MAKNKLTRKTAAEDSILSGLLLFLAHRHDCVSCHCPCADGQCCDFHSSCALCHQTSGEGIPGAFPPLAGYVPELLAAQNGRDYLVRLVLFGSQRPIDIDTLQRRGRAGTNPPSPHLFEAP